LLGQDGGWSLYFSISHTVAPFSFSLLFWLLQNQEENRRAAEEEKKPDCGSLLFFPYSFAHTGFPFIKSSSRLRLTNNQVWLLFQIQDKQGNPKPHSKSKA
jgi:hypothetical protein